jgi:hypothetical protein
VAFNASLYKTRNIRIITSMEISEIKKKDIPKDVMKRWS